MLPTNCVFATAIELPTLSDAGFLALQEGKGNAVAAIARLMERQKQRYALAEEIFGNLA
jgi:hypothetical protein